MKKIVIGIYALMFVTPAFAGPITVGGQYGLVFTDPKELNSVIRLYNDTAGANAEEISTAARLGLYSDYALNDSWSLGLSFQRMSPWTEASITAGGVTTSGRYETYTNLFGVRAKHTFYREGKFSAFVLPTIGLASYTVDGTVGASGVNQSISASATGLFVNLGIGGAVQFTETLGLSLDLGYQYAKSGALTVDRQSNTSLAVGSDYTVNGNRVKLDSSGFSLNLAVHFSFETAPGPSGSTQVN